MTREPVPANQFTAQGFTLIEAILFVAVLGVLLGIGVPILRPSGARLAAKSVQSTIQLAKFDSIKVNRPMVVVFDVGGSDVVVRRGDAAGTINCGAAATTAVKTVSLADYGSRIQSASVTQFV